ncbi:MAG: hypothetical protein GF335_00650 [Candidatus Moranbacteria bacterium]|nr:hypothetical protein [Candidatus Moranbacteria bacterium]
MYKVKKLKSGLTLVTVPIPGIKSVTIMSLFGVGSKYEKKDKMGISHFIEHMLFNGTKKRPTPKELSETLDQIGGQYNAFTGKEYTGYYVKVGYQYFDLGLEWLFDILNNPKFEKRMIEKEKKVIIEEINMYEDTPMQHIHDIFESLIFCGNAAGRDIIGNKKTVSEITKKDLLEFKNRNYRSKNCVLCISGKFDKRIEKKVIDHFSKLKSSKKALSKLGKIKQDQKRPRIKIKTKKTDQSHCILGFRAFDMFDKRRYELNIICTILGGGMSSRLFSEIREKRGLAYYINSNVELYLDSGYICGQAGLDTKNLAEALKVMLAEFKKMVEGKFTAKEVKKAKNYIKGQTLIAMESSNSQAMYYGSQMLLKKNIESLSEKFAQIDKVKKADIIKTAENLFKPQNLNLAVIGPVKSNSLIKKAIHSFK